MVLTNCSEHPEDAEPVENYRKPEKICSRLLEIHFKVPLMRLLKNHVLVIAVVL